MLREREKGVLRAACPRTPFQGEYPPGLSDAPVWLPNYAVLQPVMRGNKKAFRNATY